MKMRTDRWRSSAVVVAGAVVMACSRGDMRQMREQAEGIDSVIPQSVREELVQLGEDDQAIRQDLTPERIQDAIFARQMLRDDSTRTARLRTVIERYGWPDSVRAGRDASKAAFLILQHSPVHEFQREMLPTIETLAENGSLPRDQAALLVDRVLVDEGRPQRYGTQFSLKDGRLVMDSTIDLAGLEERRRRMGLPSMDEYVRILEQVYNVEVVKNR